MYDETFIDYLFPRSKNVLVFWGIYYSGRTQITCKQAMETKTFQGKMSFYFNSNSTNQTCHNFHKYSQHQLQTCCGLFVIFLGLHCMGYIVWGRM